MYGTRGEDVVIGALRGQSSQHPSFLSFAFLEKISSLVKLINTCITRAHTRDTKKTRERETEDECGVSVECVSFFQLLNREDEKEEEEET